MSAFGLPRSGVSLSLAGLVPAAEAPWSTPRAALNWTADLARTPGPGRTPLLTAVQLDAAAAGLRPRELDRSARRDLAATLRRLSLACSGLDLFIPSSHFSDPAQTDRAVSAVFDAIELAADLCTAGAVPAGVTPAVAVAFPPSNRAVAASSVAAPTTPTSTPPPDAGLAGILAELAARAQSRHVALCDCSYPPTAPAPGLDEPSIGLDPAALLAAGANPVSSAAAGLTSGRLRHARLSDLAAAGRVAVGAGRLDVASYFAVLSTSSRPLIPVLDLRHVRDQAAAAVAGLEAVVRAISPG